MLIDLKSETVPQAAGTRAKEIVRKCVHCGFCNSACPTYSLLGDELDGPRGRIYLIKGLLEGEKDATIASTHLDRCLTCRACEASCPSGVEYGELVEIGRSVARSELSRFFAFAPERSHAGIFFSLSGEHRSHFQVVAPRQHKPRFAQQTSKATRT